MRFIVVGNGIEEQAWIDALGADQASRIVAVIAALNPQEDLSALETALAAPGVEAALIGGPPDLRAEALRRAAILDLPAICLHPPGDTADAYYQVALEHSESPARVVPDLPLRLHPAIQTLRRERESRQTPWHVTIEYDAEIGGDLVRHTFPRIVDAAWALIGPVESLIAMGRPPGPLPKDSLTVHLNANAGNSAELRLAAKSPGESHRVRISANVENSTWRWESDSQLQLPSQLVKTTEGVTETLAEFPPWNARAAVLDALRSLANNADSAPLGLNEGMRSMELTDAVARSLQRGRRVDVLYDEISEISSFKANMASLGCGVILLALALYVLSRVGLAFGIDASKYLAWGVVALLAFYAALQLLRLAARPSRESRTPHSSA